MGAAACWWQYVTEVQGSHVLAWPSVSKLNTGCGRSMPMAAGHSSAAITAKAMAAAAAAGAAAAAAAVLMAAAAAAALMAAAATAGLLPAQQERSRQSSRARARLGRPPPLQRGSSRSSSRMGQTAQARTCGGRRRRRRKEGEVTKETSRSRPHRLLPLRQRRSRRRGMSSSAASGPASRGQVGGGAWLGGCAVVWPKGSAVWEEGCICECRDARHSTFLCSYCALLVATVSLRRLMRAPLRCLYPNLCRWRVLGSRV